jgi:hypothetical protein
MRNAARGYKTQADQAIRNSLLKGLIELITNSDDSYARLERNGAKKDGRIEIELNRRTRTKNTILRVIDWAEGMTDIELDKNMDYGEDTSDQSGRGVFGMGLKDTIIGLGGEATITSFKGGKKYECKLSNIDDLEFSPPRSVSSEDKKGFRNNSGGTVVEIAILNPKVNIPQINTLRENLQKHVCLRGIMSDPARKVILRDVRSGVADEITYVPPEGEPILEGIPLTLPDFPEVRAVLTVLRAKGAEALSQTGSNRTGGILITSQRTIHEATLFCFDDDPHASNLFGELRCDDIYDLQAKGEQIIDKNRNGLLKDHDLTKQLFEAARKEIEKLVALEKEKEKNERETLEREETRRRFREAVKNLNQIANAELQIGGPGTGNGTDHLRDPRLPIEGFEFIPDTYRVVLAEREGLKLRVRVDGETGISIGSRIEVTCDNPHIGSVCF